MLRREFLVGAPMTFINFIASGAPVDNCKVILLCHGDVMNLVNVASYGVLTSYPSVYEIDTTIKKFGVGSFRAKEATTSRSSQWLNLTSEPGGGCAFADGSLTAELWLRRVGGTGPLSAGNQWQNSIVINFDNGGFLQFTASNYFHFGSSTYRRGLALYLDDGNGGYDEYAAWNFDFLPNNELHAIAFDIDEDGAWSMMVDGVALATGTLSISIAPGTVVTGVNFWNLLDTERQDEIRVTMDRARYKGVTYTPATGSWVDATCDSAVTGSALIWYYGERTGSYAAPSGAPLTQRTAMLAAISGTPTVENWEDEVIDAYGTVTSEHGSLTIDWVPDDGGGNYYGETGFVEYIDDNTVTGRYNTTSGGAKWLELCLPIIGTPSASVAYWGAYLTDVGDFTSDPRTWKLEITADNDTIVSRDFVPTSSDGGLIFIGFTDTTGTKYKKIRVVPPGSDVGAGAFDFADFYGIDDMIAGTTV